MPNSSPGIRWGIIGTGRVARAFTRDLLLSGLQVQAVGSRTRANAHQFAAFFNIPTAHASYEGLVSDETVDVVYIATPHSHHYPNATLALSAGKHVLIEKPVTINAREAQSLADLAAATGLVAMEAMWTRFLPHMVRIRELLAAGTIGQLRALTADHTQQLTDDPAHRINAMDLGGGALLDLGVYPISFASELFGTPTTVSATATFKETGVDAQVATSFGYHDDRIATTFSSSVAKGRNVATVLGSEGRIEIAEVWYTATNFTLYDGSDQLVERCESKVEGRGMQHQAFEVESLVRTGQRTSEVMPMSESVSIMQTLDEIRNQIGLRYPADSVMPRGLR